jgi:DNA-binding IclR family transcriptional regulator
MPTPKVVRSVERAIDILLSFNRKRTSMDVSEIQKVVGLARPTLYRLLNTLERKELVRSFGSPVRYELGYKVLELAGLWLSECEIVRISQPKLEELWRTTDETIALMVPMPRTRRLCTIEIRSRQPLSFAYGVGHTAVTYLGASGKVLLAHMPAEDVGLAAREAAAKASIPAAKLFSELESIRNAGYAISAGEVSPGTVAIAAPVFDRTGTVTGAVSLYGPAVRLSESRSEQLAKKVCRTAAEISDAMGYRSTRKAPHRLPKSAVSARRK